MKLLTTMIVSIASIISPVPESTAQAEVYPVAKESKNFCRFEDLMSGYQINNLKPLADKKVEYIVVSKKNKKTFIVADNKVVRIYPVVFGWASVGHKQFEGDFKTPEGLYYIVNHNPQSAYHKSLLISYPNKNDTEFAKTQGRSPGGDVMFHGLPNVGKNETQFEYAKRVAIESMQALGMDWTRGCVAMSNQSITEMYQIVPDQTPVEICQLTE